MESNQGDWCLQMLPEVAPNTVANFLRYVEGGHYANMLVHRSVPGFVIQGGNFQLAGDGMLDYVTSFGAIANEFNRSNLRGTVAMAKIHGDLNSATNQWFINLADNTFLDDVSMGSFTVFASVAYGMEVVDRIAGLRVEDLSYLGDVSLNEVPLDVPVGATTFAVEDLILIHRAYTTNLLPGQVLAPYHCTPDVAQLTLAELCGTTVSIPVVIDGVAYEGTLELLATQPDMVFGVQAGSLQPLATLPASHASYNAAAKQLLIPSVRVGEALFDNVVLSLADGLFTLQSFSKRP